MSADERSRLAMSVTNLVTLSACLIGLVACTSGGSEGERPAPSSPPGGGSAALTGAVSGTVIKILRADTGAVIAQTDTISMSGPPPFQFTFLDIPIGIPIKAFFFSAGQTFSFYFGTVPTNVFKIKTAVTIDLGLVEMSGGRATTLNEVTNVTLEPEDPTPPPPGIIPPPATLKVMTPPAVTGDVIVNFSVQSFTIGGQGQQHLHIQMDGGPTHHFFNGPSNKVVGGNGQPTSDVQWQSPSSFLLKGLAVGQHQITVRLATASDREFTNSEANPPAVPITINAPPIPASILTISSPTSGSSFPPGPVLVSFTVQNFMIGGPGMPHLHIYLDGGTSTHFFNGTTHQVQDGSGQPVANIIWQSNDSFQITDLSSGPHQIRLALTAAGDQELQNAEANPPILNITIQAPPSIPVLTIISPAQNATLQPGPVLITFGIQNSQVGPSATQPRMHFYVDADPTVYKFYAGTGIGEEGTSSGVRYQDNHTHYVHWKSDASIQLNALASGSHQVRFVLVDQTESELVNTERTLSFTILQETTGVFSLQAVVDGLNTPVAMASAPDGRILVNELTTGKIRVVTPTTSLPWFLQSEPFATLPVLTGGERGLLGIAIDPNFGANGHVYVFYTTEAQVNRVVRFTATTVNGNTVSTSPTPEVIIDNIPAGHDHNGGMVRFGPDGMLYVVVGENDVPADAQSLNTLRGKILRVTRNGDIPSDNPFFSSLLPPFSAIYSFGHRNSFGFTFHPHTNDLWQTENGDHDNDEINRIVSGKNYGWPTVSGIANDSRFIDPIFTFTPTIAPTGIVAVREDSVYSTQYHNNLLFGDFNSGRLHRIVLGGAGLTDLVSHSIVCECGQGPLFAVMNGLNVPGQDGYVYVSGTSGIFRVVPQ